MLAAAVSYPLYRAIFGSADNGERGRLPGFLRFYVIFLGGLLFVLGGLPILVEVLGMPVLLAQAGLILAWPLLNYQLLRLWAFRSHGPHRPAPDRSDPGR